MTISPGSLIAAEDFNTLQGSVYNILGNGSGQSGYGKSVYSTPVSAGDYINATSWAGLKLDILSGARHQGIDGISNITGLPTPTPGSDFTASDFNLFLLASTSLSTNKFNLGPGQYSDENLLQPSGSPINQTRTNSWGGSTRPTVTHAFTVDFGSANTARYFFNAGGSIRLNANLAMGSSTSQNRAWNGLLSAIGTVIFNYGSTSASSGTGSSIGFYNLTTTPQRVFIASGSGSYAIPAYSSNDYTVSVSCDSATNSTGGARYLYFTISFNDYHTKTYSYVGTSDAVTGTLTSNVSIRRASGTNVNTAAPTATNTTLLTDGIVTTYNVNPSTTSINEGSTVTFNVVTTNFGSGTLYWTNVGSTSAADFIGNTNSGSVTITNDSGSFTRSLNNDQLSEGTETILIQLRTGSTSGPIVATANTVYVNDTSVPAASPTYNWGSYTTMGDEGTGFTFNVNTTNVLNYTTLYWYVNNITTSNADFSATSGSFTISNGSGIFTVNLVNDLLTEGDEFFTVSIKNSPSGSALITTSNIRVNDTSITPSESPTYNWGSYTAMGDEGTGFTFNVNTTNVLNYTTLYWYVNNITTSNADFSATSGSFTISNGSGIFTVNLVNDLLTEGDEFFTVSIKNSPSGSTLITTSNIRVNDTSITPSGYTWSSIPSSINEGAAGAFVVNTTGITNGTTLYWTIDNVSTTNSRFIATSGSFTISNGSGVFTVSTIANQITDGSTSFNLQVRTGSTSGTIVLTQAGIVINDTSVTPTPSTITGYFSPSTITVNGSSTLYYSGTGRAPLHPVSITIYDGDGSVVYTSTYGFLPAAAAPDGTFSGTIGPITFPSTGRGLASLSLPVEGATGVASITVNAAATISGYFSPSTIEEISNSVLYWTTTGTTPGTPVAITVYDGNGAIAYSNSSLSATSGQTPSIQFNHNGTGSAAMSLPTLGATGNASITVNAPATINGYFITPFMTVGDTNTISWYTNGASPGTPVSITVYDGNGAIIVSSTTLTAAPYSQLFGPFIFSHVGTGTATLSLPTLGKSNTCSTIIGQATFVLDYPSNATHGIPFTWSVQNGFPNESFYITTTCPAVPYVSGQLDSGGNVLYTNGDFGPTCVSMTITVNFYFSQSGNYTRYITIA